MMFRKLPMRLDGEYMIVGIKDTVKLIGISIISCCAVFVCTLFLNFNMDIAAIEDMITSEPVMVLYHAQVSTGKIVSAVSGGCLLLTSAVMLLFYIKHYIDTHKKELGILKALGYSNMQIAGNFWVFGSSVFTGTAAGFAGAFLMMPFFYRVQNEDYLLPEYSVHFHPILAFCLIALPTLVFSILAVVYAYLKLKRPVPELLKDTLHTATKVKKQRKCGNKEESFLDEVRKSTLKSRKTLVFFIVFSAFCYSAMTQMSFCMPEIASIVMAVMLVAIGVILACTTLFLAVTAVVRGNTKTIAMMRVFGYNQKECSKAVLGGYRPMAYLGFAIGTVYQYGLLRIMRSVVFRDMENIPEYNFDMAALVISFVSFAVIYEIVMYGYTEKIKKISVKEVMME